MVARMIARHRILSSRVFVLFFCAAVLMTRSYHEGRWSAAALCVLGLMLVGVAVVGRLWCSLFISGYKANSLIIVGPYSLCRHPLYLFSLIGFVGIGLTTERIALAASIVLAFILAYPAVMTQEENHLRDCFGPAFDAYVRRTPRLIPRWSRWNEPDEYIVRPRLYRRTMGDVVWFVWAAALVEFVDELNAIGAVRPWWVVG